MLLVIALLLFIAMVVDKNNFLNKINNVTMTKYECKNIPSYCKAVLNMAKTYKKSKKLL
jgi:hypothetical protein